MDAASIRAKVQAGLSKPFVLPVRLRQLVDALNSRYHATSPAQRLLAGSVAAIVLVVAIAWLSLSSNQAENKHVSVAAPALPTRVTLAAPKRPTTQDAAPMPSQGTQPEAMSVPLAEQLRVLQNTPVQLEPAPIESLTVATPDGLLPKIGPDGRMPWQAYARPTPMTPAGAPRLAVMLIDMGLSERLTAPALEQLPGQVTVALHAQSPKLADYLASARARGHEVLLDIPAEPRFYPEEDPGPAALMTRIGNDENTKRLRTWLAKAPGTIGITTTGGTQFVSEASAMMPVLNELKLRGMVWFDSGDSRSVGNKLVTSIQGATVTANIDLDSVLTPRGIRAQFEKAVAFARDHESVLVIARPYPLTISLLNELLGGLPDSGIALVPASALVLAGDEPADKPTPRDQPDAEHGEPHGSE